MKKSDLLLVLVPYRDRPAHLRAFLDRVWLPLRREHAASQLVVAEQPAGELFNRGLLLNAAYLWCTRERGLRPARVLFHDVDLVPSADLRRAYTACRAPVVHFGNRFARYSGPHYFGGVTGFEPRIFEDVGGFPNGFWGWGGEDDALLRRTRARRHRVCWPRFGEYEDLERLSLRGKLHQLRDAGAKCMTKRELLALEPNAEDTLKHTPACPVERGLRPEEHRVLFQFSKMSSG